MMYNTLLKRGNTMVDDNLFIEKIKNILNTSNNNDMKILYDNMSSYQKKIYDSWIDNPDLFIDYSLNDLIFDFDKDFVEKILEIELDFYLKNSDINGNKRNGYTKDISLTLLDRTININRPRLRNEKEFNSIFIPKRTRVLKDLKDNIILLFSKNNSVNDIKDILSSMFNIDISTGKISELLQEVSDKVFEWRTRHLDKCYFAINVDCTYITLRDNKDISSHKIPVYVAVGTKLTGHKEIIGIYLGNEDQNMKIIDEYRNIDIAEATSFWVEIFEDLKDRGIEKVLYIISDGLTGIENAINNSFPNTKYQRCIVHVVRNLKAYTNKRNSAMIIHDFKNIYLAPNKELALENYNNFLEKYKDNKTIIKHVKEYIEYVLPLFDIPINIRKYIYTNNIVESVNSKIKRGFYGRGALPNINSALNIIFLNLEDLEKKWAKSKVSNWNNIYNELYSIYQSDIDKYL